jgi:hypothetical protein
VVEVDELSELQTSSAKPFNYIADSYPLPEQSARALAANGSNSDFHFEHLFSDVNHIKSIKHWGSEQQRDKSRDALTILGAAYQDPRGRQLEDANDPLIFYSDTSVQLYSEVDTTSTWCHVRESGGIALGQSR